MYSIMSTAVSLLLCAAAITGIFLFGGGLCVFRLVTGFPCPGCGMTRALVSLLRGDIPAALGFHPLVFTLPVIFYLLLRNMFPCLFPWSGDRRYQRAETTLCIVLTVLFLTVYAVRLAHGWRG